MPNVKANLNVLPVLKYFPQSAVYLSLFASCSGERYIETFGTLVFVYTVAMKWMLISLKYISNVVYINDSRLKKTVCSRDFATNHNIVLAFLYGINNIK